MNLFVYFIAGLCFGAGLWKAGMTDPAKVESFLAVTSPRWDVSLMVVLAVAVMVYAAIFFWVARRKASLDGHVFIAPPQRKADRKLVLGSVLFGAGWGMVGLCPGPALTVISAAPVGVLVFLLTMLVGLELGTRTAGKK